MIASHSISARTFVRVGTDQKKRGVASGATHQRKTISVVGTAENTPCFFGKSGARFGGLNERLAMKTAAGNGSAGRRCIG